MASAWYQVSEKYQKQASDKNNQLRNIDVFKKSLLVRLNGKQYVICKQAWKPYAFTYFDHLHYYRYHYQENAHGDAWVTCEDQDYFHFYDVFYIGQKRGIKLFYKSYS